MFSLSGFSQLTNFEIPKGDTLIHIEHLFYNVGYSKEYKQSGWVAYHLVPKDTLVVYNKRKSFVKDKMYLGETATNEDYKKSGYDKGHLVPAADMRFDYYAYIETFFYTNCSPQLPAFNRGKWKTLENWTRGLLKYYKIIYIVTGPILQNQCHTIGKHKVVVPDYFYKVILGYDGENYSAVAFLMPNKKINDNLCNYIVSVNLIESLTKMDLFSELPDDIEKNIESYKNTELWEKLK